MSFYDDGFTMRQALADKYLSILNDGGHIMVSSAERIEAKLPMRTFFPSMQETIIESALINDEPHYIIAFSK